MRAIVYLRVSTSQQEQDGQGLQVQHDKTKAYAQEHGLEVVDVVREQASGGVSNGETFSWESRPKLLEIMERAEGDEFDAVLVSRLDRLSRDFATTVILERRLEKLGVQVLSAAEELADKGPVGELLRGQLALFSQFERALIRDRLDGGKAAAKLKGRHVHGRCPYGYTSANGFLVPDANASVVRGIFQYRKEGDPAAKIASRLNRDGTPTPQRAGEWSAAAIRYVLSNRAYLGERNGVKDAHERLISTRSFNSAQAA